ncbi:MAG: hypothetical protein ACKO6N_15580 [Myxococcota bacterium]
MKAPRWLKPLIVGSAFVLFHKAAVLAAELPSSPAGLELLPPPFPVTAPAERGLEPRERVAPQNVPARQDNSAHRAGREVGQRVPTDAPAPASDEEDHPALPLGLKSESSAWRLAQAVKPQTRHTLVFAGIAAGGLELVDRAKAATDALDATLRTKYDVLRLEELPAENGIPAPTYYKDCPDSEGCLGVLAQRVQASLAVVGILQLHAEPTEAVQRTSDNQRVVVELTLIDLRHFEPSSPLQIEMLGDDLSLLQESAMLGLNKVERRWKVLEAGPAKAPEPAPRVKLEEEQLQRHRRTSPELTPPRGRRGQLALRVSAGGGYGLLGQEYLSHRLVELADQPDTTVAEYSRLTLAPSRGSLLGASMSVGVTSRLELEAHARGSFASGRVSTALIQEDDYQNVTPWTYAGCEAGGENCPEVQVVNAPMLSVGLRGRFVMTPRTLTQPVLFGGAHLNLHGDIWSDLQREDYTSQAWWPSYPPLRSVDLTAGVGIQRVISRQLTMVLQVPITFQLQSSQDERYETVQSTPGHANFADTPPARVLGLPLGASVEVGLQWELN